MRDGGHQRHTYPFDRRPVPKQLAKLLTRGQRAGVARLQKKKQRAHDKELTREQ